MSEHSQDTTVSSQPLKQIPLTDQQPPGQSASIETQDHETPVLLCTTDLFSNVPVDASTFDNILSMVPASNPGEGNSGMLSTSSASLSRQSSAAGNVDFNVGSTDNSVTASPMPYSGLGHEVAISPQCNSAGGCPASCQNGPLLSNDEDATVSRVTRQQGFDMQQGLVLQLSAPIDSDVVTPGSVFNASTTQQSGVGRPESTVSNTSFHEESENQRMDCDEHVVVGGIITQQVNTSEDTLRNTVFQPAVSDAKQSCQNPIRQGHGSTCQSRKSADSSSEEINSDFPNSSASTPEGGVNASSPEPTQTMKIIPNERKQSQQSRDPREDPRDYDDHYRREPRSDHSRYNHRYFRHRHGYSSAINDPRNDTYRRDMDYDAYDQTNHYPPT